MQFIPSYRAAHLFPYIELLERIGTPVEKYLSLAGLPSVLLDRPDIYLPQLPTMAFLDSVGKREGISEFATRATQHKTLKDFSREFLAIASRSPTLLSALEHFRVLVCLEDINVRFWISYEQDMIKLCMGNFIPIEGEAQVFEDWSQLLVVIAIVRAFAGPDWRPDTIAIRTDSPVGLFTREQYPNTRFLVGRRSNWVTLPAELLSRSPLVQAGSMDDKRNPALQAEGDTSAANDFACSLKRILPAYLLDGYPSIQLMAKITGCSVRTLQRNLRLSNLTYSGLLRRTRFELAAKLLRKTDAKIIEIAYELGYEDPAHFARGFKCTAGVSPRQYREHCKPFRRRFLQPAPPTIQLSPRRGIRRKPHDLHGRRKRRSNSRPTNLGD